MLSAISGFAYLTRHTAYARKDDEGKGGRPFNHYYKASMFLSHVKLSNAKFFCSRHFKEQRTSFQCKTQTINWWYTVSPSPYPCELRLENYLFIFSNTQRAYRFLQRTKDERTKRVRYICLQIFLTTVNMQRISDSLYKFTQFIWIIEVLLFIPQPAMKQLETRIFKSIPMELKVFQKSQQNITLFTYSSQSVLKAYPLKNSLLSTTFSSLRQNVWTLSFICMII